MFQLNGNLKIVVENILLGIVTKKHKIVIFHRLLDDNENVQRKWLVYSTKVGSLFYALCRLLSSDSQFGSNEGFNDRKMLLDV